MLAYEEAFRQMMGEVAEPARETVPLGQALGRVLGADVAAPIDLPPFANSAMDGYAVHHADTEGASADNPVSLRVAGESAAGLPFSGTLRRGEAAVISTGAVVPAGADAVVRLEDTRSGDGIEVLAPASRGENVRPQAEDVAKGEVLVRGGTTIDAGLLTLLSGSGLAELDVFVRPRVAICATGTELVAPGSPLAPGQIYESSSLLLHTMLSWAPAETSHAGVVQDDPERIRAFLERAMAEADILCVCGGVSVGRHDHVKPLLKGLGVEEVFWKVRVKPGKPLYFGRFQRSAASRGWVFGIPGNPVSGLCSFVLFIEPFLRAVAGCSDTEPATARAVLTHAVSKKGKRREFQPGRLHASGSRLRVRPIPGPGSGMLHSMVGANCFVTLPEQTMALEAGSEVDVVLLPTLRGAGVHADGSG